MKRYDELNARFKFLVEKYTVNLYDMYELEDTIYNLKNPSHIVFDCLIEQLKKSYHAMMSAEEEILSKGMTKADLIEYSISYQLKYK